MNFIEDRSKKMNWDRDHRKKQLSKHTYMFVEPQFPKPGAQLGSKDCAGFRTSTMTCFWRIPIKDLPQKYPPSFLRIFSNLNSDFLSAIDEFPQYKDELLLMNELRTNSSNFEFRLLESFLHRMATGEDFIEIKLEYPKKHKKQIDDFLVSLGLLPV